MKQPVIMPMREEFAEYLRDESRRSGSADSISFPRDEDELRAILSSLHAARNRVTVQGGRTGLAAGCVPEGGHILNLSRMDRVLGLREEEDRFYLRVQPGLTLTALRKLLESKKLDTAGFDAASLAAARAFADAPEQFFSPDPTETSATLGGMAACNASGARSFLYGPMRRHVRALRVALVDGDLLSLTRGQCRAAGRRLRLSCESGRALTLNLPAYQLPASKSASGYYIEDNLDAVDLFLGSDGSLGVITELELALLPLPPVIWGVTAFLREERQALELVASMRLRNGQIAAIEYFDAGVFTVLMRQRMRGGAFAQLPEVPPAFAAAVYFELHCASEEAAYAQLFALGDAVAATGGDPADTWVARNALDRDRLLFFRHAAPEAVNMLIDERRKTYPDLTKLGTDMSVPDDALFWVMRLYRAGLAQAGLEAAIWGHIGDNHLHVNILPRDMEDYARGKQLYRDWARQITARGGAVSAEHGIGKLKADFLAIMYDQADLRAMAAVKAALDPFALLGAGNLFPPAPVKGAVAPPAKGATPCSPAEGEQATPAKGAAQ